MPYDLLVIGAGSGRGGGAGRGGAGGLSVVLLERGDFASGRAAVPRSSSTAGSATSRPGSPSGSARPCASAPSSFTLAPEFRPPAPFPDSALSRRGPDPDSPCRPASRSTPALPAPPPGRSTVTVGGLGGADARARAPPGRVAGRLALLGCADGATRSSASRVASAADQAGADVRSYTEVLGLAAAAFHRRARFRDVDSGEEGALEARCVRERGGPWAERSGRWPGPRAGGLAPDRGNPHRGSGLTRERALPCSRRAATARVFFRAAVGARTPWSAPPDVDDADPAGGIAASAEDIRLSSGRGKPGGSGLAARGRPLRAFAGLRSLAQGSAILPWAIPASFASPWRGTMLTLIGGKYTTHRSLAERVVDRAVGERSSRGRCITRETPLPGGSRRSSGWRRDSRAPRGLPSRSGGGARDPGRARAVISGTCWSAHRALARRRSDAARGLGCGAMDGAAPGMGRGGATA